MPPTRTDRKAKDAAPDPTSTSRRSNRLSSPLRKNTNAIGGDGEESEVDDEPAMDDEPEAEDTEGTVGSISYPPIRDAPRRDCITVGKYELYPTKAYNVFWWFVAERQGVEVRRREGAPSPWTRSKFLQKMYTCNSFRVLDRACQFLIHEVIESPARSQDPRELLFRILLFNSFTLPATWNLLESELGPLTWATYKRADYVAVLDEAKSDGTTLFTQAFQKQNGPKGSKGHEFALKLLELMMKEDNLLTRIQAPNVYVEDVYDYLKTFHSIKDFNAYQLVLNLGYSSLLVANGRDFVSPGVGAVSGLLKLFGHSIRDVKVKYRGIEVDAIRWMEENQESEFARLGISFVGLTKRHKRMELVDFEHAICEVDKFLRKSHPNLEGTVNSKGKVRESKHWKRLFDGATRKVPLEPMVLPKVWKKSRRMEVRVRPAIDANEPVWTVEHIVARQKIEGVMKCLVSWKGFGVNDMTWEPEKDLMIDVPQMMQDFLKLHKHGMVPDPRSTVPRAEA